MTLDTTPAAIRPLRPDTDPPTPPSGAALAAPCVECGTTGGAIHTYSKKPLRSHGMCNRCYIRSRANAPKETKMDGTPDAPVFVRRNGKDASTAWRQRQATVWANARAQRDAAWADGCHIKHLYAPAAAVGRIEMIGGLPRLVCSCGAFYTDPADFALHMRDAHQQRIAA